MQLFVDNGLVYEVHGNELELYIYRQLEAEWQTEHRRRPSGHYAAFDLSGRGVGRGFNPPHTGWR